MPEYTIRPMLRLLRMPPAGGESGRVASAGRCRHVSIRYLPLSVISGNFARSPLAPDACSAG